MAADAPGDRLRFISALRAIYTGKKEPTKHQYDFDASTVLAFLRKYGLDKDFKLNVEANHATLAQHTFQHELRVAAVNGAFGSIDANQGDLLLGWDTDQFPTNVYDNALCMYEVIKAGGFTNGGLNFDAKTRRASNTPEDIFHAYIAGMDAFALGLHSMENRERRPYRAVFVSDRYASFRSGIGADIVAGKAPCSARTFRLEQGAMCEELVKSGRQNTRKYPQQVMFS